MNEKGGRFTRANIIFFSVFIHITRRKIRFLSSSSLPFCSSWHRRAGLDTLQGLFAAIQLRRTSCRLFERVKCMWTSRPTVQSVRWSQRDRFDFIRAEFYWHYSWESCERAKKRKSEAEKNIIWWCETTSRDAYENGKIIIEIHWVSDCAKSMVQLKSFCVKSSWFCWRDKSSQFSLSFRCFREQEGKREKKYVIVSSLLPLLCEKEDDKEYFEWNFTRM